MTHSKEYLKGIYGKKDFEVLSLQKEKINLFESPFSKEVTMNDCLLDKQIILTKSTSDKKISYGDILISTTVPDIPLLPADHFSNGVYSSVVRKLPHEGKEKFPEAV